MLAKVFCAKFTLVSGDFSVFCLPFSGVFLSLLCPFFGSLFASSMFFLKSVCFGVVSL